MRLFPSAIAFLLCLFLANGARADTPNMRQCINYFMNYFNESVVQAIHVKEYLALNKTGQEPPYSEEFVFFSDLTGRIEKTLGLALNLCDVYYIYNKTTYCFTKDEKRYIFDRIDNITETLLQIRDAKYNVPPALLEDKKSKAYEHMVEFNDRIDKLRAFIKSSLDVFQR